VFQAIANQSTIVTPLAGAMPSAQLIVDGLKYAKADALILAPPFLEQTAVNEENLSFIGHTVDTVIYGGGGISQKSGDALASRVKLLNSHAATEIGSYPLLRPAGKFPYEDWKFIFPHPAAGLVFRPSIHGLFESVIIRHSEPEDEQPVFKVFPHLAEYPTKDLWEPYPTKPNLWTHKGRVDDTIVFKPGYMCDPTIMEQQVLQHPEVKAVLMAGTGRSQPALLIEGGSQKRLSRAEEQELLEQLWPIIEEANKAYKLGARVSRSHIVFTRLQQPIRRTGKGTVQRASTLEMYKDTLDELYAREGDAMPENQLVLPRFDTKSQ